MLMRLPTRFHMLVTALRVRVISPKPQCGRNTLIRAGSFAGPFLPATRFAFPWAICKDRDIDGRGSVLPGAIKLENVLDCQGKISEAVERRPCSMRYRKCNSL